MELFEWHGVVSDELQNPPLIRPALLYIYDWFCDLNHTRRNYVGMSFAFGPLSYTEISHYFELHGIKPSQFELDMLMMFDRVYLEVMNG